jgi:beta-phosphoglucomutase
MIDNILDYDTYLFDLDGTLINTEPLHHQAYETMIERLGYNLGWDFEEYLTHALVSRTHLFEKIYERCPDLRKIEPDPEKLRQKKVVVYEEIFAATPPQFMPGVCAFLDYLKNHKKQLLIVTNSPRKHVERFDHLEFDRIFESIITIDDFIYPKPSSASYLLALEKTRKKEHEAIIFEDSLKGVQAAIAANIDVVLIATKSYQKKVEFPNDIHAVESFCDLMPKIP